MNIRNRKLTLALIISLLINIFIPVINHAEESTPSLAPLNPEYIEYMEKDKDSNKNVLDDKNGLVFQSYSDEAERENGLVPEPFTIERDSSADSIHKYNKNYPDRFDLRDENKLTPVKDQGQDGSCWTFASYGALESYLMPDMKWDFSENNMKNTHGFDYKSGGNRAMSAAYMARHDGPVLEEDDPFREDNYSSPTNLKTQKHLTNALYIPDRNDSSDNNVIKYALQKYGAVQTSYYSHESYYSDKQGYYYNGNSKITNHAVTIVGWDDNYSKNNFKNKPREDGAFIVKNSWGEKWGNEGYFHISYEDKFVGTNNSVYIVGDTGSFDNIYQYDPLGMTSGIGYGDETGWFANVFTSSEEYEELSEVGFFVRGDNSNYEIFLTTEYETENDLNNRVSIAKGSINFAGYHNVNIDQPQSLKENSKFAIVVKITTPGTYYPIPIEKPLRGYSSKATAKKGQSFIGSNGDNWKDTMDSVNAFNSNVTLKAFTTNTFKEEIIGVESLSLNKSNLILEVSEIEKLIANILPKDATNKNVTWSTEDSSVARVNAHGEVEALTPGKTKIVATSEDGNKKSTCDVTVREKVIEEIKVESIKLNKDILNLKVLESERLIANILPKDASNQKITWSSSDSNVARVDELGKVTALRSGEAIITARTKDGNKTSTCKVHVEDEHIEPSEIKVENVELNKKNLTLEISETEKLIANILPEDATNKRLIWSSSDSNIVTVDNYGQVTALNEGEAIIEVMTEDESKTSFCKVTVKEKEDGYTEWAEKLNVKPNKEWEIKFNDEVRLETIKNENIYIKDSKGNIVEDTVLYFNGYNIINIKPLENYSSGEYWIYIQNIESKDKRVLHENIKMKFTVE